MTRKLLITLLSIGIIVSVLFSTLKFLSLGEEDSSFNRHVRPMLAVSPTIRHILGLHYDGGAKADYLGKKYDSIQIEVDTMSGIDVPYGQLGKLRDRIQELTGKNVTYLVSEANLAHAESVGIGELEEIFSAHQDFKNDVTRANLYVLLASRYQTDYLEVGTTFHDNGVVMFMDSLKEFTRNMSTSAAMSYFYSTLLHEFGHQLGLPHNNLPGCLMNPTVDEADYDGSPQSIITDFCEYETQQITATKAGF